jgi:hypothetical protein
MIPPPLSPWCVLASTFLGVHVMFAMLCLYTAICLYFLALYVRAGANHKPDLLPVWVIVILCEGFFRTVRHVFPRVVLAEFA